MEFRLPTAGEIEAIESQRMVFRLPTAEEIEAIERQQSWRVGSVKRLIAARAARLQMPEGREESINRALDAYKSVPDPDATVRIRADFVALSDPRPLPPALGGPKSD